MSQSSIWREAGCRATDSSRLLLSLLYGSHHTLLVVLFRFDGYPVIFTEGRIFAMKTSFAMDHLATLAGFGRDTTMDVPRPYFLKQELLPATTLHKITDGVDLLIYRFLRETGRSGKISFRFSKFENANCHSVNQMCGTP
ncbi:hypothetical protein RvY_10741 [Ramazzottius varieornatus]|uniref:Uncharacterized protein n=1 Tax=Ramazzottius varieornatus TaxID=947166 RepID=A0A1D1VDR6_RAMVA|nr:hypothetical protein RvY_10741 [Ramazzottius varieornatus]